MCLIVRACVCIYDDNYARLRDPNLCEPHTLRSLRITASRTCVGCHTRTQPHPRTTTTTTAATEHLNTHHAPLDEFCMPGGITNANVANICIRIEQRVWSNA